MSLATLLPALLLGLAGAAALIYLLAVLAKALKGVPGLGRFWAALSPRMWLVSWKMRRKDQLLSEIETALRLGDYGRVQKRFQRFFEADPAGGNSYEEGMEALKVLLKLADQRKVRITNLPVLEELLFQRQALRRKHSEALAGLGKTRHKEGDRAWAKKEFESKRTEAAKQLSINQSRFLAEITKVLQAFQAGTETADYMVH